MSETIMYYFSGTGNSLVVAKAIAAKLGGAKVMHIAHTLVSERFDPIWKTYRWTQALPPS
jgi:flavodoxin